jgi:hypothetical protein
VSEEKDRGLEEMKLAVDVMKHMTTLSTGSLLLIVALHEKFAMEAYDLVIPAFSLVASLTLAVMYLYWMVICGEWKEKTPRAANLAASASVFCFTIAIGALANIVRHGFH